MRARRRFGQHFLEPAWIEKLLAVAGLSPGDHVVEIGPGRGALTWPLSRRVAEVTAIEIDRDLAAALQSRAPDNVHIIEADFLALDVEAWLPPPGGPAVRVLGNLPYNVSSPILFRLLEAARSTGQIRDAIVMLQREVAERIASPPGSKAYGVLSVQVQLDADPQVLLSLPPGAFRPAPEVWSTVLQLRFRPPAAPVRDRRRFDVLVRALFAHRRKTTGNALRPLAASMGRDAALVLREAGLDPGRRPETLHLVELARLADALGSGIPPAVV